MIIRANGGCVEFHWRGRRPGTFTGSNRLHQGIQCVDVQGGGELPKHGSGGEWQQLLGQSLQKYYRVAGERGRAGEERERG
jgi:hypothetical protein